MPNPRSAESAWLYSTSLYLFIGVGTFWKVLGPGPALPVLMASFSFQAKGLLNRLYGFDPAHVFNVRMEVEAFVDVAWCRNLVKLWPFFGETSRLILPSNIRLPVKSSVISRRSSGAILILIREYIKWYLQLCGTTRLCLHWFNWVDSILQSLGLL